MKQTFNPVKDPSFLVVTSRREPARILVRGIYASACMRSAGPRHGIVTLDLVRGFGDPTPSTLELLVVVESGEVRRTSVAPGAFDFEQIAASDHEWETRDRGGAEGEGRPAEGDERLAEEAHRNRDSRLEAARTQCPV